MNRAEKEAVKAIGQRIGFGRVMQLAEECWREAAIALGTDGGEHTCGPCAAFMVRCPCLDTDEPGCDWCCGSGRVTERVRQAMVHAGTFADLAAAVDTVSERVGCSSYNCVFGRPEGAATQGRCHCVDRPGAAAALGRLYRAARKVVGK